MAARHCNAGDGPWKRALSCGSSNSSNDEDIEFVSESESDMDFNTKRTWTTTIVTKKTTRWVVFESSNA
ncbi:unnamed protein product [Ixodes pacificus]